MKTLKLQNKDAYDLAAVTATIVREKSESLDFKEVITLQKTVNNILSSCKAFADKYEEIIKERDGLIETANKKISSYRQKFMAKADKDGVITTEANTSIEKFISTCLEEVQSSVSEAITPQFEKLNKEIGSELCTIEIEEGHLSILVINFEKYAKEKYTNKSKMVEIYEAITV